VNGPSFKNRHTAYLACVAGHLASTRRPLDGASMGYIIIASSVFTIFMRIKGQSSVLCGDQ
jgi:hypothetical protein